MAAEAIETEAKKRGWWVKVETRGSVGAGNAITPEEVAEADLVIVAADIEVDLAKFAGKPMYRTTTGLALKKTAQSWIKRWRKPNRTSHPANLRRLLKGKRVGGRLSPPADRRLLYAADGSGRGPVYRALLCLRDQSV